jgi:hypothetical protein
MSKVEEVGFGSGQSIRDGANTSFLNSSQNALSDNLLGRLFPFGWVVSPCCIHS